jgi:Holliday junction resolvase RusA-like endonuclease
MIPTAPAVHRLDIPAWTPTLLNELLHYHRMKAARLKRHDREAVALFAKLAGIPKATGPQRVSVMFSGWPRGRLPDPDAPLKSLLDALVSASLLADDGPRWCELGAVRFVRTAGRRTVVMLEELAGGRR